MKIIILGAGQVGSTLAAHLTSENNDITVIDSSSSQLQKLQERLDIRTLVGCASFPSVLNNAGAADTDMLIAVTSSDDTNMIACQISHNLFNIPTKIARIRTLQYLAHESLFGKEGMPIDVIISPEQLVTNHIKSLIEYPDALQVLNFANGRIKLISVKAHSGGELIGQEAKVLHELLPDIEANVVAIFRDKKGLSLNDNFLIESGDEVFFLAMEKDARAVMGKFRNLSTQNHHILLAGGGNIGTKLALSLEEDYKVKVVENNEKRVEYIASQLKSTIILEGDASDKELLESEEIENTDIFCSITNSDETNILSALLAKKLGVKKAIALNNRAAYIDVIEGGDIDVAVSPHQATVGSILTHIRRGDVVSVHSLCRGTSEAIEVIAHGDKDSSQIVGRISSDVILPEGANLGAIIRGEKIFMQPKDLIIEENDHVVIFLADKCKISEIESLFHVEQDY